MKWVRCWVVVCRRRYLNSLAVRVCLQDREPGEVTPTLPWDLLHLAIFGPKAFSCSRVIGYVSILQQDGFSIST